MEAEFTSGAAPHLLCRAPSHRITTGFRLCSIRFGGGFRNSIGSASLPMISRPTKLAPFSSLAPQWAPKGPLWFRCQLAISTEPRWLSHQRGCRLG